MTQLSEGVKKKILFLLISLLLLLLLLLLMILFTLMKSNEDSKMLEKVRTTLDIIDNLVRSSEAKKLQLKTTEFDLKRKKLKDFLRHVV